MVMLREANKAYKIAKKVLKQQGVKVRSPDKMQKVTVATPFVQR